MGHSHLNAYSREILQRCLSQGMSLRAIGKILGYSASALCKERKRNSRGGEYCAHKAHQRSCYRRTNSARQKSKYPPALEAYIFEKMFLYWSPEQVVGRLALDFPDSPDMRISFKTIYRRIAHGVKKRTRWHRLYPYLRLKKRGKCLRNHSSRKPNPYGNLPSIAQRPATVAAKARFGDWESDLIAGPRGQGFIATFVERTTQFVLAAQCPTREPKEYNETVFQTIGRLPAGSVLSVTVDRGSEFYGYREIEESLGMQYYFCHPRCPNERGLNEQMNGLLRQFFPKGRSLLGVGDDLKKAVALINHRPRKRLGYYSPMEAVALAGMGHVLTFI